MKVPAIFIVGKDDKITPPRKVEALYNLYKGTPKKYLIVEGEHHSEREPADINYAIAFIEANINFKYVSNSIVPFFPTNNLASNKLKKDYRKNQSNPNNTHQGGGLQGVSRGQGLDKIPLGSPMYQSERNNDYNHHQDENQNPLEKSGWDEFTDITSIGWHKTKMWGSEVGEKISHTWTNIFGGCGQIQTVDMHEEDAYDQGSGGNLRKPKFGPNKFKISVSEKVVGDTEGFDNIDEFARQKYPNHMVQSDYGRNMVQSDYGHYYQQDDLFEDSSKYRQGPNSPNEIMTQPHNRNDMNNSFVSDQTGSQNYYHNNNHQTNIMPPPGCQS